MLLSSVISEYNLDSVKLFNQLFDTNIFSIKNNKLILFHGRMCVCRIGKNKNNAINKIPTYHSSDENLYGKLNKTLEAQRWMVSCHSSISNVSVIVRSSR